MSDHLTPVEVCERLIGPLPVLERIAGYRPKGGYSWRRSSQGRPAGDFTSARLMRQFLAHAAAHNIPLTADHLIWGASASEVDALLANTAAQPVAAQ
jgi:hypothetical protein